MPCAVSSSALTTIESSKLAGRAQSETNRRPRDDARQLLFSQIGLRQTRRRPFRSGPRGVESKLKHLLLLLCPCPIDRRFQHPEFQLKLRDSANAVPTNRNYTTELSTFGIIAGVNPAEVQWSGLALGPPPT